VVIHIRKIVIINKQFNYFSPGWGLGVGLTTLPCKNKIVEEPSRNSAGFSGGGQGLSWAVEPRKEELN
jgi:hypothetical protein